MAKAARVRATTKDFVLDVGSGGHPHSSADVLVDRFIEDTLQHRDNRRLIKDRPFILADATALPFRDKSFDYVICNQVVERLEQPSRALDELARVGKRGYLSTPSELEEMICTVPSHLWVFAEQNGILLFKRKQPIHKLATTEIFGGVFWMLHDNPIYRRLMLEYPRLFYVNLEWEGSIDYREVSPSHQFYDYHDVASVRPLLERARAADLGEQLRRQLFSILDLRQIGRIAMVRRKLRALWIRFVGRPTRAPH